MPLGWGKGVIVNSFRIIYDGTFFPNDFRPPAPLPEATVGLTALLLNTYNRGTQRASLSCGELRRRRRKGGREEKGIERRRQAHARPRSHPQERAAEKEALSKDSREQAEGRAR